MEQVSAPKQKLVVLGNGMAAGRVLEELFERAPERYDVTIFGAEPRVNYDRIMLSPVLAGDKQFDDIVVHDDAWYARHKVDLRKGEAVIAIDRTARTVRTQSGATHAYDALIIATGSRPILIPVPGAEMPGVVTFRDLDDVDAMLAAARKGGNHFHVRLARRTDDRRARPLRDLRLVAGRESSNHQSGPHAWQCV